jgi:hypothetical protein
MFIVSSEKLIACLISARASSCFPRSQGEPVNFQAGDSALTRGDRNKKTKRTLTIATVLVALTMLTTLSILQRARKVQARDRRNGFLGLQHALTTGLKPGVNETELLRQSRARSHC